MSPHRQKVSPRFIAILGGIIFIGISLVVATILILQPDRTPMVRECENRGGTFVKTVYASFCVKSGDIVIVWTEGRKFENP